MKLFAEEMFDYKDKISKQMQVFESECMLSLHNMKQAIERQQSTEDVFFNHVKHMEEELKRMDLQYETEKAVNS